MPVEPGLSARVHLVVGEIDTALALGSGDVPVLATPRLIALCEEAACLAVEGTIGEEATLEKVEGRRLVFTVTATDAAGLVGAGKLTRVVVDRGDFLAKSR